MEKGDVETFVKNYKKGSTKVYCGRGMVVGCFGAGKTTLVKKLKGEDVSHPPESTRGLEVHTNIFVVDEEKNTLTGKLSINATIKTLKKNSYE
jgi:GTPase SAR1 family protein